MAMWDFKVILKFLIINISMYLYYSGMQVQLQTLYITQLSTAQFFALEVHAIVLTPGLLERGDVCDI